MALTCSCASCRYSGVLSAYGLALADVVEEVQEPCSLQYDQSCFSELDRRVGQLSKRCHDTLCARGFDRSAPTEHRVNPPLLLSSLFTCLLHSSRLHLQLLLTILPFSCGYAALLRPTASPSNPCHLSLI